MFLVLLSDKFVIVNNKKNYFCWRALTAAVPLVTDVGIDVGFVGNCVVGIVKYGIAVKWGVKSNVVVAGPTVPVGKPN